LGKGNQATWFVAKSIYTSNSLIFLKIHSLTLLDVYYDVTLWEKHSIDVPDKYKTQ